MSRGLGEVQWSILEETRWHPGGFELNPCDRYSASEQSSRRRAAYSLERKGMICLGPGREPYDDGSNPIVVYPGDHPEADRLHRNWSEHLDEIRRQRAERMEMRRKRDQARREGRLREGYMPRRHRRNREGQNPRSIVRFGEQQA